MFKNFAFSKKTKKEFENIKRCVENKKRDIPVIDNNKLIAHLVPITYKYTEDTEENDRTISMLSEWRRNAQEWFPSQFTVTDEGTKKWLKNGVLDVEDRILFLIKDLEGINIGHMGFYRGEIDNCLRGNLNTAYNGYMTRSLKSLIMFGFKQLYIKELHLRTFSDNEKAKCLYNKCEFKEVGMIPLISTKTNGNVQFEELPEFSEKKPEKYYSVMQLEIKT